MALAVVLATFLLMFLAFGSLVLPVQAIVMNILSLGAMFGVVTWIFQDGHLSGLLGFTPNGTISPTIPVLMFAIMFGLSMDYQVFLLSRIRESYDITGDNTRAIASGLQRTGGVITSAALLLVIVIGLFSLSSITFIKMLGVGMIVALILDATLVRMLLVPAVMRLARRRELVGTRTAAPLLRPAWHPRRRRPRARRSRRHPHPSRSVPSDARKSSWCPKPALSPVAAARHHHRRRPALRGVGAQPCREPRQPAPRSPE